jgi:acyl-CoA hydrolase
MKRPVYETAGQAVTRIKSGDRVFVHGGAATPHVLLKALMLRHPELKEVELVAISTQGEGYFAAEEYQDAFRINSLFVSANIRKAVQENRADYIPIFLSEIPGLFTSGQFPLSVALLQVSPPDAHGYCSLGVSVDVAKSASKVANVIIAQVNPNMPRTHGDGLIALSEIDVLVAEASVLPEISMGEGDPIAMKIGQFVSDLVEDGATLQMGIGAIPDAALSCMGNHRNLGIHTEMFSDGVLPLVQSGVVNNSCKTNNPGRIVTGFVLGSRKLYDFVADNPFVIFMGSDYVNDDAIIRQNPKVTAINSAIEIDLTGQVCSDSIGTAQFSGVGGQMDFIRGASLSKGGKPIIALPSTTHDGTSRIVSLLKPGAGVVTTRAHVHYVVTEYGTTYLFGKNLRQRARSLISISHPQHREMLEKACNERFGTNSFSLYH